MMSDNARPLMLQGTASHVGKSIITAALCRIFREHGLRDAPFKAQKMVLNLFVIIHGKVYGNMKAAEYHRFKKEAARYVLESYRRLEEKNDLIIIEGAGSPAEINLRENDIANMGLAEMVDAPVILIGDIDRGGVFASLVGTMELLTASEKKRVKGFIINKFRGDLELLKPGLDFLENKTGLPDRKS